MKQTVHINLDIEKVPEGYYVATSMDVQGLVAQGKTFEETIEIAEDVAKVILRAQKKRKVLPSERIFYPNADNSLSYMGRLSGFKYREIIKRLRKQGFEFFREAKGSHEIWHCEETERFTTIPKHRGDMPEGTVRAILQQAGVEPEDFLNM
jgi:predicted RNA binding protein YcfA (HicA-like mRNA interferase family)/predicted RNase H-like HicB family nuclease